MEAIHKKKGETARIKALKEQVGTNHGASVGMTTVTISSFSVSYTHLTLPTIYSV